jgi:hypothetical protein
VVRAWIELYGIFLGGLSHIVVESNLYYRTITVQGNDEGVQQIRQKLAEGDPKDTCFQKDSIDVVWFGKTSCDSC